MIRYSTAWRDVPNRVRLSATISDTRSLAFSGGGDHIVTSKKSSKLNKTTEMMHFVTGGNSAVYNVTSTGAGQNGNAAKGGSGINMFSDPQAVYSEFRRLILGLDTTGNGAGIIRGFPTWNLDATVSKDIRATERIGATLIIQFTNILNHFQPANPTMNIDNSTAWGVVTNQATSTNGAQSRQLEFGLRIRF